MNRSRLYRGLRIVVSAVFGVLCVLLIVLWVRSYWWRDEFSILRNSSLIAVQSHPGRLVAATFLDDPEFSKDYYSRLFHTKRFPRPSDWTLQSLVPGFNVRYASKEIEIVLPYWFLVFATATLAGGPWLKLSRRFSLRTLLIATTLVAVLLGLVVCASK